MLFKGPEGLPDSSAELSAMKLSKCILNTGVSAVDTDIFEKAWEQYKQSSVDKPPPIPRVL